MPPRSGIALRDVIPLAPEYPLRLTSYPLVSEYLPSRVTSYTLALESSPPRSPLGAHKLEPAYISYSLVFTIHDEQNFAWPGV